MCGRDRKGDRQPRLTLRKHDIRAISFRRWPGRVCVSLVAFSAGIVRAGEDGYAGVLRTNLLPMGEQCRMVRSRATDTSWTLQRVSRLWLLAPFPARDALL
jgi:hypothetical protein